MQFSIIHVYLETMILHVTWIHNYVLLFLAVGREAKGYIDAGKLVPDETMVKLIADELDHLKDCGWLLDGEIYAVFKMLNFLADLNFFVGLTLF